MLPKCYFENVSFFFLLYFKIQNPLMVATHMISIIKEINFTA